MVKSMKKVKKIIAVVVPDTYGFFRRCHCIHPRCICQALHLPEPDISREHPLISDIC